MIHHTLGKVGFGKITVSKTLPKTVRTSLEGFGTHVLRQDCERTRLYIWQTPITRRQSLGRKEKAKKEVGLEDQ